MKKRMLSVLLAALLLVTLCQPALAAHEPVRLVKIVDEKLETAAEEITQFAADNSQITLAAGRHEKWIDRLNLPSFARSAYAVLEEAVDNDGINDYLIEDRYFALSNPQSSLVVAPGSAACISDSGVNYAVLCVASVDGTITTDYASKCLNAVYQAFDRDHPEVFWLNSSYQYLYVQMSSETRYYLVLAESDDGYDKRYEECSGMGTVKSLIAQVQSSASQIVSATFGMTRFDTLSYFNDWLTHHNQYNTAPDAEPWDMYESVSALLGQTGTRGPVCEGYSRALKVLCDRVNIPCVLVSGDAITQVGDVPGGHMWNYVQMEDGMWYAMDTAWNDPSIIGVDNNTVGAVSGIEDEMFLLVGANTVISPGLTFLASHPEENQLTMRGVAFTNGPVLRAVSYSELSYSGMPSFLPSVGQTLDLQPVRTVRTVNGDELSTYTYRLTAGTLPQGLTLNETTGEISGTLEQMLTPENVVTVTLYENGRKSAECRLFTQAQPMPFVDVPMGQWYYDAVSWATQGEITNGKDPFHFMPDNGCKRGEIVTFLWRAAGRPQPRSYYNPFADVAPNAYYYEAVLWAVEQGITNGVDSIHFNPDGVCKRGQVVTFLWRAAGNPAAQSAVNPFADVGQNYYTTAVLWAVEQEITNGTSTGVFSTERTCTRGQIVTFLYRARAYLNA